MRDPLREPTFLILAALAPQPLHGYAIIGEVADLDPAVVRPDADLHAIVRKMSDFNLAAAPVVDGEHKMIGVVTVDDVLELLLPSGWRRDFGVTSVEE